MISGGNKMSILDNMFGNEDSMEKAMKEMGEQFFYIKVLNLTKGVAIQCII